MNPALLEKVLSCKRLPTLPAVALRVLELTKDQNVSFKELAATITNDVALASKVLRTVNSSFYALRKPCASINQAIVMLGLSAVKTLALGFSLVSSVAKVKQEDFDLQGYWRRALISGIAAKCISAEARVGQDEECFLGGLLQDVGVIALLVSLEGEYAEVLRRTGGDHYQLAKHELAEFDVAHPDIGALLTTRWRLPAELVMPVKYHERPTAAPQEYVRIVQAVALGNIVADVINGAEPGMALKRLYTRAEQWLGLRPAQCDEIVARATQSTREVARLFDLDVGAMPAADALMAKAGDQLREMALPLGQDAASPADDADPVTGLPGRSTLSRNVVAGFEQAQAGGRPLTLALVSIDALESLTQAGTFVRDAAFKAIAAALGAHYGPAGALITRYDQSRVAVLLPGVDRVTATRLAESVRDVVGHEPVTIRPPGLQPMSLPVTISLGVATLDELSRERIVDPETLVGLAEQALAAAQRSGAGAVRVFTPRQAA